MEQGQRLLIEQMIKSFQIRLKNAGDWICDDRWTCCDRQFGYDSIGYIKRGTIRISVSGVERDVEAGGMYYIPMMQTFSHRTLTPTARILWTHFSLSPADRAAAERLLFPVAVQADRPERIEALFSEMLEAMAGDQLGTSLRAGAMMQLLFSEFLRLSDVTVCDKAGSAVMQRIAQYIRENLHRSLTVEQLAEQAGLAPGYFIREFERLFQESPIKYMLNQKEQRARSYLENSDLSIKQISLSLGFSNQNYFSAFFKKRIGCTPSEYRNQKMCPQEKDKPIDEK